MKTLIIYGSKYGCTEKAARLLAEKLPGDVNIVNVAKEGIPSLDSFDNIVVGGSIYVGKIQSPIREFCDKNIPALREKNVGLFICAANEEQAAEQLRQNFPTDLIESARITGHFGYAIRMDKMNFLERTAIKMIMKTKDSSERILEENINRFANELKVSS